jgi:hypothetical protein
LPIIADVDADGNAEIVMASNNYYINYTTGIRYTETRRTNGFPQDKYGISIPIILPTLMMMEQYPLMR